MDHRTATAETRINAEADRQKLSARQLSDSTGIAYPTVQGILTGTREPKLTHLYLLADALNIEVADLIDAHIKAHTGEIVR